MTELLNAFYSRKPVLGAKLLGISIGKGLISIGKSFRVLTGLGVTERRFTAEIRIRIGRGFRVLKGLGVTETRFRVNITWNQYREGF